MNDRFLGRTSRRGTTRRHRSGDPRTPPRSDRVPNQCVRTHRDHSAHWSLHRTSPARIGSTPRPATFPPTGPAVSESPTPGTGVARSARIRLPAGPSRVTPTGPCRTTSARPCVVPTAGSSLVTTAEPLVTTPTRPPGRPCVPLSTGSLRTTPTEPPRIGVATPARPPPLTLRLLPLCPSIFPAGFPTRLAPILPRFALASGPLGPSAVDVPLAHTRTSPTIRRPRAPRRTVDATLTTPTALRRDAPGRDQERRTERPAPRQHPALIRPPRPARAGRRGPNRARPSSASPAAAPDSGAPRWSRYRRTRRSCAPRWRVRAAIPRPSPPARS